MKWDHHTRGQLCCMVCTMTRWKTNPNPKPRTLGRSPLSLPGFVRHIQWVSLSPFWLVSIFRCLACYVTLAFSSEMITLSTRSSDGVTQYSQGMTCCFSSFYFVATDKKVTYRRVAGQWSTEDHLGSSLYPALVLSALLALLLSVHPPPPVQSWQDVTLWRWSPWSCSVPLWNQNRS